MDFSKNSSKVIVMIFSSIIPGIGQKGTRSFGKISHDCIKWTGFSPLGLLREKFYRFCLKFILQIQQDSLEQFKVFFLGRSWFFQIPQLMILGTPQGIVPGIFRKIISEISLQIPLKIAKIAPKISAICPSILPQIPSRIHP